MKYKKILSAFLIFCLVFCSAFSASAYEFPGDTIANVNADGKIDASDALQVLQYSVGSIRRFPQQTFGQNISGCLPPDIYHFSSKEALLSNLGQYAERQNIPALLESYIKGNGIPFPTCNSDKFSFTSGGFYTYNWTAEYGEIEYTYKLVENKITALELYVTPTGKGQDLSLESEFASSFERSEYSYLLENNALKKGNVNGMEYLYWEKVGYLRPGCVFMKDGYIVKMILSQENQWWESYLKTFDFELVPVSQSVKDAAISWKYGDVNRDNKIDASDALKILQYSVGLIKEF